MRLDNNEIFAEFWKENKDKYPHISFDRMKEVVTYPFVYFRDLMKGGTLATMRFKHLGIFTVHRSKAISESKKIVTLFKEGRMLDRDFFRIKKALETYIEKTKEDEESN